MVGGIRLGSPPRPPQTYHMQERYAQHKRKSRWCKRPPLRFTLIWAAFVFVLTVLYKVHHDTIRQPLSGYKVGWQAHDKISVRPGVKSTAQADAQQSGQAPSGATSQEAWDSEALDPTLDPSFPLDAYAPLLPNPAPITDITVESCSLISLGPCLPRSSQLKEANLGRWVRVDRPLGADSAAQKGRGAMGGGVFDKLFGNIEVSGLSARRRCDCERHDSPFRHMLHPSIESLHLLSSLSSRWRQKGRGCQDCQGWRVGSRDARAGLAQESQVPRHAILSNAGQRRGGTSLVQNRGWAQGRRR